MAFDHRRIADGWRGEVARQAGIHGGGRQVLPSPIHYHRAPQGIRGGLAIEAGSGQLSEEDARKPGLQAHGNPSFETASGPCAQACTYLHGPNVGCSGIRARLRGTPCGRRLRGWHTSCRWLRGRIPASVPMGRGSRAPTRRTGRPSGRARRRIARAPRRGTGGRPASLWSVADPRTKLNSPFAKRPLPAGAGRRRRGSPKR